MSPDAALAALREDPTGESVGLALPPGALVPSPAGESWFWLSSAAPDAELVERARAAAPHTGLWPVLLGGDEGSDDLHPTLRGHLGGPVVSTLTAAELGAWVVAEWNLAIAENEAEFDDEDDDEDDEDEERISASAPAGVKWPGPAPAGAAVAEPTAVADALATYILDNTWLAEPRLALVPCGSSAGALLRLGWTPSEVDDITPHAAIVRGWEDRFGARVVALKPATLYLSVAAPPASMEHALHVAAEHLVFCPDAVFQISESYQDHAESLVGETHWDFWWD